MDEILENVSQVLRLTRYQFLRLKMHGAQQVLAEKKGKQRLAFDKLSSKFEGFYKTLSDQNMDKFTTPLWKKYNGRVESALLPNPSFSFLRDPGIMYTMFATSGGKWLRHEMAFLEKKVSKSELRNLLEEDYVGDPLLFDTKYLTSHTAVHHLYHFIKFLNTTNTKPSELKTIVEWGGGYGSMIRILRKHLSGSSTYVMIDTPLFSCLQWIFLSTIFGERNVNLLLKNTDQIKKGKINIVPLNFLDKLKIKADLFISTWALSESSKYSQDYVMKRNWFDAKHLLIAFQENPAGLFNPARVGELAKSKGAIIEDIEFLSGNHYAFK